MANIFKDKYGTGHKVAVKDRQGLTSAGANALAKKVA